MKRVRPQGAAGRASLPPAAYRRLVWMINDRANWRCERCRAKVELQVDHAILRSHGGPDAWWNLTALCGGSLGCHAMKDRPYSEGRLRVVVLGEGRFKYEVCRGSKVDPRLVDQKYGGRPPTESEAEELATIMREARRCRSTSSPQRTPDASVACSSPSGPS